jgi:non-ribosomal peptide synthetase component F/methionyl-tRNA formyltransferase/acyl carrier protein
MGAESRFTCCLIGQRSLLILCGDELLARGHGILGVATENDEIQKWAAARSLAVLPTTNAELGKFFSGSPCDYLLSVINYRVLPDEILRLPKQGAINFHDGPLPGYAGVYVTTWALINGEPEHGISWHWMTKEIDAGGVLKEKRFPVASDETAVTLNSKCYEAGFDAFRSLLTDLEQRTTSSRPQTGHEPGGYYGLRQRPARLATLDWSRPAEELGALFRSLDFGRYENPIGCPKVVWGDRVLIPGRFAILEQQSTRPPGTFERRADSNAVAVHTATKIVEVGSFSTLDGEPVEIASLPTVSPDANSANVLVGKPAAELDPLLERICIHESFWATRLAAREAVTFPYVPADIRRDHSPTKRIRHEVDGGPLADAGDSSKFVARALAAVSLYLGRLNGKEAFDLDYQGLSLAGLPREAARYFAASVPLPVRLNWTGSFSEHVQSAAKAIAEVKKRGTYARDLVLRFPQLTNDHRQKLREVPDVAVAVLPNASEKRHDVPRALVAFLISPSETKIEINADAGVFDEQLLTKIAAELAHVIAQVGSQPDAVLAEVAVVAPAEQAALDRLNLDTRVAYEFHSLPQMFEEQVARTPDAAAVVFHGQSISYRELQARANQVANLLVARGVKRGDLVGVLMDRSIEMVVSLWGVLKVGAAYVPLDPAYPSHRLAIMVEDARPALILTQAARIEQVAAVQAEAVAVDRPDTFDGVSTATPHVAIEANDLAYVMYTSGSTGRPKGATVTHGNIQNFFLKLDHEFAGDPPATWLGMTSISFDISVPELFWTLTRGGKVVLRGTPKADQTAAEPQRPKRKIDFSLFFRNVVVREDSTESPSDRLRREASRFAAEHDFSVHPEGHADETANPAGANQPPLSTCVQADDHPDNFQCAAQIGANILTRLLGQPIETLAKNITLYRRTWKEAGHPGEGRVTLLVPTFVSANEQVVKNVVRGPLKAYLKRELSLVREAAWEFPAFQKASEETGQTLDQFLSTLSEAGLNELLEFAFERYYRTCGLFGTRAHCLAMVERLKQIGVDEIACLIDFGSLDMGMTSEQILQHLPELNALRLAANNEQPDADPDDIATLIERHGVTHLSCTPSRAASLTWGPRTRQALGRLKLMIMGGETLPEELARQLRSIVPGRVFNVYGPTETTVWSTMHELLAIDGPVPIGKPIANTQLYVVDERQRPLPLLVPGELLIGGDGVGRGYMKRPDLTEARFLKTGYGTVYRTGDLVRLRPDGTVDFLGRLDDQVKIRGHRIELGEIEAVLESHASVRKAVVHPQDDAAGGKRLVAYVVPQQSSKFDADGLRTFVSGRLPEFMVPSHFESLSDLPTTPSGKVDRRALPKPNFGQRCGGAGRQAAPPSTPIERRLAELWQKLLEVRDIDRADNFFELGGHSLLGMQAISQIQDVFGVRLPTKTLLVSSLTQVAAEIDRLKAGEQQTSDGGEKSKSRSGGFKSLPQWFRNRVSFEWPKLTKDRV